jgi:hypothetical protein
VVEIAALPDPSSNAVLSAEGFVDECLLVEGLLELIFSNAPLDLVLNESESVIEILYIHLLVKELAKIFD